MKSTICSRLLRGVVFLTALVLLGVGWTLPGHLAPRILTIRLAVGSDGRLLSLH